MKNEIKIFYSEDWKDYELLDTGAKEKLERLGKYTFIRPLEGAIWPKTLSQKEWERADGKFWTCHAVWIDRQLRPRRGGSDADGAGVV